MRKTPSIETKSEFIVEGIHVVLMRKKVKNINFRVKTSSVEVSAPHWVDESSVKAQIVKKASWILSQQEKLRTSVLTESQSNPQELAELKKIIALHADPYFTYWESRIGVQARIRAYREMSSRWGSCNSRTGRICLNTRLLEFPEECLEYVIVHELCHLIEANHGPRFKALMDEYLPEWQKRRARLRRAP